MEKARDLLHSFIDKKLNGDIEKLASYDMEELKHDTGFGCKRKRFEYDNTELVKAIFVVLWHKRFEERELELTSDTIGDEADKYFRGDTIHTTGSIAGDQYWALRDKYDFSPDEIEGLKKQGQMSRIGNMLLLPKSSIERTNAKGKKSFVTINTYRGFQSGWHDYFDIFLDKLKACFPISEYTGRMDEISLQRLVAHDKNYLYFQRFTDFNDWFHCMMLDDCVDSSSGKLFRFFPTTDFNAYPYYWRKKKPTEDDITNYKDLVNAYFAKAGELIEKRSNRMVKALDQALKIQ